MDIVTAARVQMAVSLAFHMVFAALGIGMPVLMLLAEGLWLRTRQPHYRDLAKKWAKATALLFAVGAVSGTALSFELGLLWPRFMGAAGSTIGPAFALEGFAFFIEAIFLGLYLYGWDRLSPLAHWLTGIPVALSGMLSGVLVVAVNAWMQAPVNFFWDGVHPPAMVDPWATFRSPAWFHMALHSTLACYVAVGFAAAGVYAVGLLRGRRDAYHRAGLCLSMALAAVTALLQPISGHLSGQKVADLQPIKLAAMEGQFETEAGAPLRIGGIPDAQTGEVRYAIEIPGGLSLLAKGDPNSEVQGLRAYPRELWPNVLWVHLAFQVMVGFGMLLVVLSLWFWWVMRRREAVPGKRLLWAVVLGSPLGFLALEAGWFVTELGRQPWIIYQRMRVAEAATSASDVPATLLLFTLLYVALGCTLVVLLLRLARLSPAEGRVHGA